ncbi:protein kinase [Candidatus Uabimicrobium helgolandensis]
MLWQEEDILAQKYKIICALDSKNTPHKAYKVYDINWDRPFRLKCFCPSLYSDENKERQFIYFLKKWISLSGCHEIVNVYYIRKINNYICLVSEYLNGCNLQEYIDNGNLTSLDSLLNISIKIGQALSHAAQVNIVHTNLKCENILISRENLDVKVTDFLCLSNDTKKNLNDYRKFLQHLCNITKLTELPQMLEQFLNNDIYSFEMAIEQLKQIYEDVHGKLYLSSIKSSRFEIEQANKQALSYLEVEDEDRAAQLWFANMTQTPPSVSATWNWHLLNFRRGLETLDQFLDETEHLSNHDLERISCAKALLALETGTLVYESLEEILFFHSQMPKTLTSQRLEGELFFRLGEHEKAIAAFEEVLQQQGCSADDWYRLGAVFFENKEKEKAFAIWEQGHKLHPNHLLLLLGKATHFFENNELENTQHLLEEVTKKYPDIFWANLHAAEFFSGQGLYQREVSKDFKEKAISYYRKIICDNPNIIRAIRGFHTCSNEDIPEVESVDILEGWMQMMDFDHPENLITAIDVSRDGLVIASGDCEGNIIIWDSIEYTPLFGFSEHEKHISKIKISDDGSKLVSASWDHTICIWDLSSGKCLHQLRGHSDRVDSIDISSNYVLSGSWDGTCKVWEIKTGKCLTTIDSGSGWIKDVALCNDHHAIYCDENENMHLWDIKTQQVLYHMQGGSVIAGNNGELVSTDQDGIYIWESQTGELLSQIETFDHEIAISLSEDGYFLLTRNEDDMLKIWYLPLKYCITILFNEEALCGAMTQDVKTLISANGCTISIWNNIFEQAFPIRRKACFLQPKSTQIAVPALIPQKIRQAQLAFYNEEYENAYDTYRSLQRIPGYEINSGITKAIQSCAVYGQFFISGVNKCIMRKMIHTPQQIWCLDTVDSGNISVTSSGDDPIAISNLYTDYNLSFVQKSKRAISSLKISNSGKFAVLGSWDHSVTVWNLENTQQYAEWQNHTHWVNSVQISHCEKYILSGGRDGQVFLWNIEDKTLQAQHKFEDSIYQVHFLNSEKAIICEWNGNVHLWNFSNKCIEASVRPHCRHILDIAIANDKKHFAVTSRSKKISIFDIETMTIVKEFVTDDILKDIHLVDYSVVIGTTYTGKVCFWHIDKAECIYEFQAHRSDIAVFKVIEDRLVLTASDSNEICIFEIDWIWSKVS